MEPNEYTTTVVLTNDQIETKNQIIDLLNENFGDIDTDEVVMLLRDITGAELENGEHLEL